MKNGLDTCLISSYTHLMIITARYPSTCPNCQLRIKEGQEVEWNKGEKARHTHCVVTKAKKQHTTSEPAKPSKSKYPTSAPQPGAHQISGRRTDRNDKRYMVGDVLHLPKVAVPGGGSDQHYYVVLACQLQRPNEDMGHYDWTEYAWVRAATDEEAATKASAIRQASAPKTVIEYVIKYIQAGERLPEEAARNAIPSDATIVWTAPKSSAVERVAIVNGYVIGYHGGFYDDYRASAWRCLATDTIVLAVEALVSGNAELLAVAADAVMGQAK